MPVKELLSIKKRRERENSAKDNTMTCFLMNLPTDTLRLVSLSISFE